LLDIYFGFLTQSSTINLPRNASHQALQCTFVTEDLMKIFNLIITNQKRKMSENRQIQSITVFLFWSCQNWLFRHLCCLKV